jgi:hypothetical protein
MRGCVLISVFGGVVMNNSVWLDFPAEFAGLPGLLVDLLSNNAKLCSLSSLQQNEKRR